MELNKENNPGTGNMFQEIHIEYVENYMPNVAHVTIHHYGDRRKAKPTLPEATNDAGLLQRKDEIIQYVDNLEQFVAKEWKNRYEATWRSILDLPEVAACIYEPGKQKNTTFNRNLVANILYIICRQGIITEQNATTLTLALEGDKDHPVRAQLRSKPNNPEITREVERLLKSL